MRARVRRNASPPPNSASPKPMQDHRFSPVKGSVLPDPLDDEVLDTELGADGESVEEPEVEPLEVLEEDVVAVELVVCDFEWE
jgi:hypothetical protein